MKTLSLVARASERARAPTVSCSSFVSGEHLSPPTQTLLRRNKRVAAHEIQFIGKQQLERNSNVRSYGYQENVIGILLVHVYASLEEN